MATIAAFERLARGRTSAAAAALGAGAGVVLRYGLVAVIAYFGAFKFTGAEAHAIEPLVANSPLLSWLYAVTDVIGASRLIGAAELLIAVSIALRGWRPALCAAGSLGAAAMFITTLSFLFTTPGMWQRVEGFVVPANAGAFVIKDVFLLAAAAWSASEALGAVARERARRQ